MSLARVLGIDQDFPQIHDNKDIDQIYNDEDVKLFGEDLIDIASKAGRSIGKSKRHDLILEVTVSGLESCLPFVTFSNPYPMVRVRQVQLDETLGTTEAIKRLSD